MGPRPYLFNQGKLIADRVARGVLDERPDISSLAQTRGTDMSNLRLSAETDAKMFESLSLSNYFRYIFQTILGEGSGDRLKN